MNRYFTDDYSIWRFSTDGFGRVDTRLKSDREWIESKYDSPGELEEGGPVREITAEEGEP